MFFVGKPSRRWFGLAAVCFLSGLSFCAWHLGAQSSPARASTQQTQQPATTLRVTTRLVQVNLVVLDKKGVPVAGLTKEDFSLLDQGHNQAISIFSQEGPSGRAPAAKPLPPNVFTNRLDETGQAPGSVTVILFDALNTKIQDQMYARQQIVKFLKQLQPRDRVAIYALTGKITVLHDFTQDTASLLRVLEKYRGQSSAPLDASTPDADSLAGDAGGSGADSAQAQQLQDFLDAANQRISDFYTINRAQATTAALEAIANHLARIPGRKNLIWVSGSFPIAIGLDADSLGDPAREIRTFGAELERAARAMNQADLAIYPVDARGLMTLPQFSAANRGPAINPRRPVRPFAGIDQNNFATMNTLAERTGGQAFYNTNDIAGSARRALSDGQLTYSLGYYPDHGKWDGKFHEIKIHVNRPGLQIRYRKGYFATPDPPSDAGERKASLDAAAVSPIDSMSLGIQAQVNPMQPADSGILEIVIWLDLHELQFSENAGRRTGDLDLLFIQRSQTSQFIGADQKHMDLNLEKEKYDALLQSGINLTRHLPLKPGATSLKIVVRDGKSGALGTVTIPLGKLLPSHSS